MSEGLEYKIEETRTGAFIVTGPVLTNAARFENREKALAFCRYAIGGRAGGGFIHVVNADGISSRDFFQSGTHLSQDGLSKR